MTENFCLLSFKYSIGYPTNKIQEDLKQCHSLLPILEISAVFKKLNSAQKSEYDEQVFVLKVRGSDEFNQFQNSIQKLEAMGAPVLWLTFGDLIQWSPDRTLPAPALNFDSILLHCAAEVAPSYIHPVLKRSLRDLDVENISFNFEFIHQGKIYIEHLDI